MRSVLLAALLIGSTSQIFGQSAGRAPGMQEGVQVHGDWVIDVRNPTARWLTGTPSGMPFSAPRDCGHHGAGSRAGQLEGLSCRRRVPRRLLLSPGTVGNLTMALSPAGTEVIMTGTVTATSPQASQVLYVGT